MRISCIYAQNIPFMGVYQDVLLLLSTFLHQWLHTYCRIQNTNTNYNDENTRICLSTRKRLDRHPWRVCFERQKKPKNNTKLRNLFIYYFAWAALGPNFVVKLSRRRGRSPGAISFTSGIVGYSVLTLAQYDQGCVAPSLLTITITLILKSYIRHEDFLRPSSVTLVLPPMKSETGWTGELWSNRVLLILEN